MATASAAINPKQLVISPEQTKLLSDKRFLAAISLISSIETRLRPSLLKLGQSFDEIQRVAGSLWSWWLSNRCQQQTGISATCAKEYQRIYQRSRLQIEDNPVAKAVFEQADVSRPRNIERLNRALRSKSIRTKTVAAGSDRAKVERVVASVIAKANAKPDSTERSEKQRIDSAFQRVANLFAGVVVPKNATKKQIAESRRLARIFKKRVEGLAAKLKLDSAGFRLTIHPTNN